jgi:hypothetical protein
MCSHRLLNWLPVAAWLHSAIRMILYIQSITFLSFSQGERSADASVSAGPPDPAQSEERSTPRRESESSLQTSAAASVAMTPKSPTLPPHLLDKRRLTDNPPPSLNRSHSSAHVRQPSGGFANQQQPIFRFESGEHAGVHVPSTASDVSAEQNSPDKSPMLPKHLLDRSRFNQPAPSIRKCIDSSGQPSVAPTAGPIAREQPETSSNITNDEQAPTPTPSPKPRPRKTPPAAQQHAVRTGAADSGSPQTAAASLLESEIDQALPEAKSIPIPAGESPATQTTTGGEPEARNEGLEGKTSTSEAAASEFTLQPAPSPKPKPKPRPRPQSPRPVASAAESDIDHWPPPVQLSTLGVDCDQSRMGLSEMNTGSPVTSKVPISPSPKPRPPPPKAFD